MVIELNRKPLSDHTEQYITRHGGAREIVTKMDVKDIKLFLKHYKMNGRSVVE